MRISTKLSLFFIGIGAVIAFFVSFFIFNFVKDALEKKEGASQLQLAEQTMDRIDRLIYDKYLNIQVIAQTEPFRQFLLNGSRKQESQERFKGYISLTGPWDVLNVVSKDGQIVLSSDLPSIGDSLIQDAEDGALISAALSGQIVYSDAHVRGKIKKPTMLFAAPIADTKTGKVLGAAVGFLAWQVVQEVLLDFTETTAHLHNRDGLVIAASDKETNEKLFLESFLDSLQVKSGLAGKSGTSIGWAMAHNKMNAGESSMNKSNTEALISYAPQKGYLGYRGNGWALTLELPSAIAFKDATDIAFKLAAFMAFLAIFLSAAVAIIIKSIFIEPIQVVTEATKKFAAGDFNRVIQVRSRDEIGELAASFNSMAKDLKRLYASLEEERAKAEAILFSIGEAVLACDKEGKVMTFNMVAEIITGFSSKEALGKHYSNIIRFVREDNSKPAEDFISRAITIGKSVLVSTESHTMLVSKDGHKVPVADSISPIRNANNEIIGGVIVFRDITAELEIDKAKSEFISLASHQLQTPPTALSWILENLSSHSVGELNDTQRRYIANAFQVVDKMKEVVSSLLNVSRLELGTFAVEPAPQDYREVVKGILREYESNVRQKKINIKVDYADDIPMVPADPGLARVICENLISNAIKYTSEGGDISISVSLDDSRKNILIKVKDTGRGIPSAQQGSIFKKMFRADNVQDVEGTGLGLYLVKYIVEFSGGKIWFDSIEGKGTVFYMSLPISGMAKRKGSSKLSFTN